MVARLITEFLKDQAKEYALDRGGRAINEHISLGPEALTHVQNDLAGVFDKIHKYQASIHLASLVLRAPRLNDTDYLRQCVRAIKPRELNELDELRLEIQKLHEKSFVITARVKQVTANFQRQLEADIQRYTEALESMRQNRTDVTVRAQVERAIRSASMSIDSKSRNWILTQQRYLNLQEQLASALETIDQTEAFIESQFDGFVYFYNDCQQWSSAWARRLYGREN